MSPDFDELVGPGLEPAERARLERVHELLLAVGPPPEPIAAPVELRPARRRWTALAIAAAVAIAAFALGAALVDGYGGRTVDFVEAMEGTPSAPGASASLVVFDVDDAGNWPLELTVRELRPTASSRPFELWLTRDGELGALCGSFVTNDDGFASVPMNAPYPFDEGVGWVVVEEGTTAPLLTT